MMFKVYEILRHMLEFAELCAKHRVAAAVLPNLTSPSASPQLPSEYEVNPELLFYRITHLNHRQQYLIWAAAVTTAGRGNFSDKVTVEPAAKGGSLHVQRNYERQTLECLDAEYIYSRCFNSRETGSY